MRIKKAWEATAVGTELFKIDWTGLDVVLEATETQLSLCRRPFDGQVVMVWSSDGGVHAATCAARLTDVGKKVLAFDLEER